MKYAVITGASGGMGIATTKRLIAEGYYVFGLDIKKPEEELDNFEFIKTDLTDQGSVDHAFKKINKTEVELDAIISTAGMYDISSLIEMDEKDFTKIFDVNVFGVYRLNKAFVPLLKDGGKVIMVSSELAPLDPLPFTGIYGITKSTLEKYAFSLRMELQLLNKQVVVIRPGAVATSFIEVSNSKIEKFKNNTELYKENAKKFDDVVNSVESRKIPTDRIGKLISKVLKKKKPKYVYKINRNPLLLLMHCLPKRTQNWAIKKLLTSKEKKV